MKLPVVRCFIFSFWFSCVFVATIASSRAFLGFPQVLSGFLRHTIQINMIHLNRQSTIHGSTTYSVHMSELSTTGSSEATSFSCFIRKMYKSNLFKQTWFKSRQCMAIGLAVPVSRQCMAIGLAVPVSSLFALRSFWSSISAFHHGPVAGGNHPREPYRLWTMSRSN